MTQPDSTAGFTVESGELRAAARQVAASVDELDAVRQQVAATDLTHDDWGSAWLIDPVRTAYQRARSRNLDGLSQSRQSLESAADHLLQAAREYERSDQAVTDSVAGAAGVAEAAGDNDSSRPSRP